MGYEQATAAARFLTGYRVEQGLDQQQLEHRDKQADPRRRRLKAAPVPSPRKVAMAALPVPVAWPRIHVLLLEAALSPCRAASSPLTSGVRLSSFVQPSNMLAHKTSDGSPAAEAMESD